MSFTEFEDFLMYSISFVAAGDASLYCRGRHMEMVMTRMWLVFQKRKRNWRRTSPESVHNSCSHVLLTKEIKIKLPLKNSNKYINKIYIKIWFKTVILCIKIGII